MVHPGIVVGGVIAVVVTGVVIYTIIKEDLHDFMDSFERTTPMGHGRKEKDDDNDDNDDNDDGNAQGYSTSWRNGDYELKNRRPQFNDDDDDEKDLE
ncbi:hypothetical protein BGZ76_004127, partial [Entomortierella beljakovae]